MKQTFDEYTKKHGQGILQFLHAIDIQIYSFGKGEGALYVSIYLLEHSTTNTHLYLNVKCAMRER